MATGGRLGGVMVPRSSIAPPGRVTKRSARFFGHDLRRSNQRPERASRLAPFGRTLSSAGDAFSYSVAGGGSADVTQPEPVRTDEKMPPETLRRSARPAMSAKLRVIRSGVPSAPGPIVPMENTPPCFSTGVTCSYARQSGRFAEGPVRRAAFGQVSAANAAPGRTAGASAAEHNASAQTHRASERALAAPSLGPHTRSPPRVHARGPSEARGLPTPLRGIPRGSVKARGPRLAGGAREREREREMHRRCRRI